MNNSFYGREEQIQDLERLWAKRTSSLVTCRGRRRIGKSTLIEHFAKISGATFIKIEGLRPNKQLTNNDELAHFSLQLAEQTRTETDIPKSWLHAFVNLDAVIKNGKRTVVLLNEISWMAHYDPTFAGTLKIACFRMRQVLGTFSGAPRYARDH